MINAYAYVLDKTKQYFDNNFINGNFKLINTITQGGIDDVDLSKRTIFPLVHIMVSSARFDDRTITFNMSVISMDVVDISKEEQDKSFYGIDNEVDVLNSMLTVLGSFYVSAKRGDIFDSNAHIEQTSDAEMFTERFENKMAGWVQTFDLTIPNELGIDNC